MAVQEVSYKINTVYAKHTELNNKIFNTVDVLNSTGYLTQNGGFAKDQNYKCQYTEKVPCSENDTFIYSGMSRNNAVAYIMYLNDNIISYKVYQNKVTNEKIVIPSGVNFIQFASFDGYDLVVRTGNGISMNDRISNNKYEIENIKSAVLIKSIGKNLFNPDNVKDGYIHKTTTNDINITVGSVPYLTSEYIQIDSSKSNITITPACRLYAFVDINKSVLTFNDGATQYAPNSITLDIPENSKYIIFSIYANAKNNTIAEYGNAYTGYEKYNDNNLDNSIPLTDSMKAEVDSKISKLNLDKFILYEGCSNLVNPDDIVDGHIDMKESLVVAGDYKTTGYIVMYKDKPITISPACRKILYLDSNKKATYLDMDEKFSAYTFIPEYDGYIRVSYHDNPNLMISYSESALPYEKYDKSTKKIEEGITLSVSQINYIKNLISGSISNGSGNVLYGKKYVACGDSFTEGDFSGWADENGLSGKNSPVIYDSDLKMYKTYPYWIAKRNGMTLINEAKCGSILGYSPNYVASPDTVPISTSNPFAYTRYKSIPLDADYITIKFGINDEHQSCPIGTIDDTTADTFLGAWNVVLEYLITNLPYAKIGIIVTNGSTKPYTDATIQAAKKWGIAYLDYLNDDKVPLMLRCGYKSGVCTTAANLRMNQQKVGSANAHPNLYAHMYESTIVENFLRSL